jgi:DNA polymerase-3 subunit gamma/tau
MLSANAFNAFLKTLEEPPPYAIFILATTEKHKILPTILSRCQIFDFKRIVPEDTVKHLEEIVAKENIKAERNALQLIAQKSEGCMRDALSILDKIVSFSNGALTYENTLEHLNILDEGYFFKLLTHLTEEDLTSAMLLYDEINQKGFEGDTVLYGMAAFIRNILVCKDKASAHLLESIEGWRDQYLAAAEKISTPYLVSALNILNEAEIQFKMARNKRLHVELALIKLNFLQQAIELSMEDGQLVKKKLVDAHYPIRTKKIIPLSNIVVNAEAKLVIETATPVTKPISTPIVPANEVITPAVQDKTIVEPVITTSVTTSHSAPPNAGNKKSLLAVLQQKYGNDYNIEEVKEAISLDIETLQLCWNEYAIKMEKDLKHSVAGTFRIATLQIEDPTHFTITVPALTAQKFVEQERMTLMETIWERFQNRAIQFSILVDAGEKEDVPLHLKLNSKQKFDHIAKQYPLVQQLKERLNLEVNF